MEIIKALKQLYLPINMINVILSYIFSTSVSMNWNGSKIKFFQDSRSGLRQRDHISPYLFLLSLERLGHEIQYMNNQGM